MDQKNKVNTRRKFLKKTALAGAGLTLAGPKLFAGPAILNFPLKNSAFIEGVHIGVITYSFRSMADQSAEATLQYVLDSGINAIELMGGPAESFAGAPQNPVNMRKLFGFMRAQRNGSELTDDEKKEMEELQKQGEADTKDMAIWRSKTSMEPFEKLKKMYHDAGVRIYAFKPRAFGKNNTDAEINWGMKAAKALGASHITLEHPSDDDHTLKLGKMAEQNGIAVGYHGHEQQTPTFWDTALQQSPNNALNLDLGHYVAAGNSEPLDIIKKHHARIKSMHIKDRQNPANGKKNLVWGTGDTPIAEALRLMKSNKYTFPATVELEYDIAEGSNAVEEVKKCLDYCRTALS